MVMARKGDLVQIHVVVLDPDERPETLPEDTKAVPYEAWIKGFLLDEAAEPGDEVRIRTFIGRRLSGTMVMVSPVYDHDFGRPRAELLPIADELFARLGRGKGQVDG